MTDVGRVVIRPPNWLGDAVMALPAMVAVRRHFPNAHVTIAAAPAVAALFREDTDVRPDGVIELPASNRAAAALVEGGGFDLGVLFPNSFRSAWQLWRARVPERWGYARAGRGMLLTRRSAPSAGPRDRHHGDYYRRLVRGLGIPCDPDTVPALRVGHPSVARADALLAEHGVTRVTRLVGFAPGAAYGHAKQWPPDRMAAVAARIMRGRDAVAVVVGASHDRDSARAIESWLREHAPDVAGRLVNLAGRTSVGALAGVLARLTAFVTNDSGAMHVAAALGCPVVAVFGPTDERATRPIGSHAVITASVFCRPCLLRECPIDHRCMKRVTSDAVTDRVLEVIDRGTREVP